MTTKLFLIALLITTVSSTGTQHIISTDGVNGIRINHAVLKDVKKVFPHGKVIKETTGGKNEIFSALYTDGSSGMVKMYVKKQTSATYTLKDEGISFYFCFTDTLSNITIWGKNKFVTDQGIILGKSTFHDLDSIYGTKEWSIENNTYAKAYVWMKQYKNLSFYSADTIAGKSMDSLIFSHIPIEPTPSDSLLIDHIEI